MSKETLERSPRRLFAHLLVLHLQGENECHPTQAYLAMGGGYMPMHTWKTEYVYSLVNMVLRWSDKVFVSYTGDRSETKRIDIFNSYDNVLLGEKFSFELNPELVDIVKKYTIKSKDVNKTTLTDLMTCTNYNGLFDNLLEICDSDDISSRFSYVYIIEGRDHINNSFYKIGVSEDPEARLATLQTGNPYRLTLLEKIKIDWSIVYACEKDMHAVFKNQKMMGEWFKHVDKVCTKERIKEEIEKYILTNKPKNVRVYS